MSLAKLSKVLRSLAPVFFQKDCLQNFKQKIISVISLRCTEKPILWNNNFVLWNKHVYKCLWKVADFHRVVFPQHKPKKSFTIVVWKIPRSRQANLENTWQLLFSKSFFKNFFKVFNSYLFVIKTGAVRSNTIMRSFPKSVQHWT